MEVQEDQRPDLQLEEALNAIRRSTRRFGLLLTVPLLVACGSSGDASGADDDAARAEARAEREAELDAKREEAREQQRQQAQADYDECVETWGPFREKLTDLNSRISVGMNVNDYLTAIGDARVEYDRVDLDAMGSEGCLDSAMRLENAFNAYLRAGTKWQECNEDFYCDFDDSAQGSAAQKEWVKASTALTNSQNSLDDMAPSLS